jgi:uncharacterized protein (TIGR01244 family)
MTKFHSRLSSVLVTVALLASLSLAQTEPSYKELANFHKVSDTLYRGGQPAKDGVKKLAELGIKTIVNLRGEDENSRAEQKEAEAAGLRYFSISMPGLSRPTDKQIERALEIINNPENGPIFVHCKRGSDRTGTVIAAYRISREGWTDERAISEARKHGMSFMEFGMRNFISDYYRRQSKSRAESINKSAVTIQQ